MSIKYVAVCDMCGKEVPLSITGEVTDGYVSMLRANSFETDPIVSLFATSHGIVDSKDVGLCKECHGKVSDAMRGMIDSIRDKEEE